MQGVKLSALLLTVLTIGAGVAIAGPRQSEIAKLVAEDLAHEVRPGGVDGRPFWNGAARFFMYPPSFDFPTDESGISNRFEVVDARGRLHVFTAAMPTASLAPIWSELPTGWTSVMCLAIDGKESRTVLKGSRTFWKQAPFTGNYPPAACGYDEFCTRAKGWLYANPAFKKFLETHDAADCGYWGMAYPSKMIAAVVNALCSGEPSKEDLSAACAWADWLISVAEKPESRLAYFTPTYYKTTHSYQATASKYAGQTMLVYPAEAGDALVRLYEKTGERKYLEHAKGIAETYLRLQGADGTWFLKMDVATGKPVNPNRLMPLCVINLFESLYGVTKDERLRAAANRAFSFIEQGPLKNWNWEGQFEDVEPDAPYRNLTKHTACDTAIYMLKRYPGDKKRVALAREILRFAEDQFVCWEKPFPDMPEAHNVQNVADWVVPGVLEQYSWYLPIDASVSKLIMTYLALYRAEGNPLDLAKAKALGDSMTRMQREDGDVPTHWHPKWEGGCAWWNCLLSDIRAMNDLYSEVKGDKAGVPGSWFMENVYGVRPKSADCTKPVFSPIGPDSVMMRGAAVRKRALVTTVGPYGTNSFSVTVFLPTAARGPVPAFLLICNRDPKKNIDPERTVSTEFWPAEEIVRRGYAAVAFHNEEVAPDDPKGGCRAGVFACFEDSRAPRAASAWGTLSAWAWGASRVMDWLETIPEVDAKRVAVVGHSRGGKAALLAGVTDRRFALVCSNDSGCSGAKLNRMEQPESEHIKLVYDVFPHWFCSNYAKWRDRDADVPYDQDLFVAQIAPRLLAIGSAADDAWAGPRAEEACAQSARRAWKDPTDVNYHLRPGGHDLNLTDWSAYMDFAARKGW